MGSSPPAPRTPGPIRLMGEETHFLTTQAPKFSNKYYQTGHFAHNPSTKSKGVVILLSADIQFHLEAEEKDREERYLFLKGYIGDSRVTLANLYLQNKGQNASLVSALKALDAFSEGTVIIGGDFNAPLDPRVDTSKGSSTILDHVLRGMRTLPPTISSQTAGALSTTQKRTTPFIQHHTNPTRGLITSSPNTETWMH
ncbi:Hypothetical predicted protein [Pelobates cultripes]|uniref:Endonuclease/exonuclease/phosphatase domain-containing protein n=1 Tax=Pelobates cultripes TaxID=61616 RepID=A0AAD1S7L7_PELCU|nr:Hypothetical predicted protein [Pelobates cultripes]